MFTLNFLNLDIGSFFRNFELSKSSFSKVHKKHAAVFPQSHLTSNKEHQRVSAIFCENTHKYDGNSSKTGLVSDVGCSHFLDLFSACTKANTRNILCSILHKRIKEIEALLYRFDFIAVPKEGNVLLADALCQCSGKPILIVRSKPIRFDYPFEGDFQAGKNVLIVDDIGSDGNFLLNHILTLRKFGAKVNAAICLVNRTDGNAEKILTDNKLSYYYLYSLNDDILQRATN